MVGTNRHADFLLRLLRSGSRARAEKLLESMMPADVAAIMPGLRPAETRLLVEMLFNTRRPGKVLLELPAERLPEVLEPVEDERLGAFLMKVAPDDAIALLAALTFERRERVLARLPSEERRQELDRLLRYPVGTAGHVMNPRCLALPRTATAQQAIDAIRTRGEQVEAIFYLYVVDDDRRLQGVVPIRRLVAAPPERPLEQFMLLDPVAVQASASQEDAANLVAKYNLLAVPVVDPERRLLGVMTVDDVIDVLQEEATQDIYRLAGLAEEDRVFSPVRTTVRRRFPWTTVNLFTACSAAAVIGVFEGTIAQKVTLAAFMPVVAGMGGNMGTQTLTVITRGIALGEFEFDRSIRIIGKNMLVGCIIGAGCGVLTAAVAWIWKGDPLLGLVLFLAMVCNMSIAGLVGSCVPILLKKLNQDPALGGSVLITAFTDVCGFMCFLGIARLIFHLS